jgi:creatinine amidohydrolase
MNENKISYGVQSRFSVFDNTMVEMTWQEVQSAADRGAIVLLPIGIVEAHGPHLDLSADFYLSTLNCRFLKHELGERGIEALIAPPLFWGISRDVAKYAGTFSVRPETMKALLMDILTSLKSWGFRRVFVQNAHGDPLHIDIIKNAIAQANEQPDFRSYFMWELGIEVEHNINFPQLREERYQPDYHAGAIETAQMNTFFPEKVRCEVAKALEPSNSFHPLAYCGDPASYDQEYNIAEFTCSDVALDVLKIEAILKRDGR